MRRQPYVRRDRSWISAMTSLTTPGGWPGCSVASNAIGKKPEGAT